MLNKSHEGGGLSLTLTPAEIQEILLNEKKHLEYWIAWYQRNQS